MHRMQKTKINNIVCILVLPTADGLSRNDRNHVIVVCLQLIPSIHHQNGKGRGVNVRGKCASFEAGYVVGW